MAQSGSFEDKARDQPRALHSLKAGGFVVKVISNPIRYFIVFCFLVFMELLFFRIVTIPTFDLLVRRMLIVSA